MKNIIITGTSRGIGFEMVRLFAAAGHNVIALSRNDAPVKALNLKNVSVFNFDISEENDLVILQTHVREKMPTVDIVIHNAGLLVSKPFSETSMEDFKNVYGVNVFGVAALTKALIPFIKKDGHVVAISSMGGIQGSSKFAGLSAYSSSKGAVITLIELLAEEFKETGPSFNALALGAVQTEMLAEAFPEYKASLSAPEMAQYIVDFALKGNKFYNGKVLQVSSSTP